MLLYGLEWARLVPWAGPWRLVTWAAVVVSLAMGVGGFMRSSHVVHTRYGHLRGLIVTPNHRALTPVAVFLGVPYASPPVGALRFMPPTNPLSWNGIKTAEMLPPVCPQKLPDVTNRREALKRMPEGRYNYLQRLLPLLSNQSEDCLHLNIYTPVIEDLRPVNTITRKKLPVMVYIHGESYEWNSGNPYDGSVLASFGQVVVITVNFRLGVLGFLRPALRENYVSNFGLLDQIAALHWIKSNIENFGGDPENVTIFGHGTGAALANFLLISPVAQGSQGLFQRAILMSGTALSRWAVTWEPYKYTIQVAKALGCPLNDRGDILTQCLQRKSVEELLSVNLQTPPFTTPLGPIIDNVIVHQRPIESMKRDTSVFGKYDLLYGVALAESHHMLNSAEVRNGMNIDRRNRLLRAYIANNFDHHASQIYYSVINQYTPWNQSPLEDERKVRDQTLEILSDAQITAPVIQMADLHSNINQRSYFYVFNHQSIYGDYPVLQGTVHGEELPYVFGAPLVGGFNHFGLNYTLDEVFLSELVMTHLTNFARSGNPNLPTPQEYKTPGSNLNWVENMKMMWPPYEKQLQQYLHIDMQVVMKHHYRAQPIALWNNLIPNLISSNQGPPVPLPPGATPPTITLVPTIKPTLPIPFTEHPPTYPDNDWHIPGKPKPPQKPDYPDTYPEEPVESQAVTPTPPPPVVAGTPISIVIVVGICILFINCCAMGGVYYQRDKIRHQSRLLRKTLRPRKAEDSEERVSDAATSTTQKERTHRKKGSRSDYEVSDEIHSDSVSRASGVSRESTMRRKHSQPAHDTASKHETPKSSLKSTKSPKSGHKRHKSENSIYSEIGKTADVHVHAEEAGPSRSKHAKNPTVKFNTLGASLPPKAVTKSTTSITSKASIKSNTSRASVKSTASRSSIKSTSSEKRLKKNASCQSLPTAEYTWGITPEMTMTERDDPDGRDDQRSPADRQQTLVAMQKLNYPKVLPDRPEVVHAATLPKMRPPPPPRSTSLTAHDIQELEDKVHVVYRKKRNQRRDASTDSCDLSGVDNIYLMGADVVPSASMYGAPAATATVSRTRSRKTDGTSDYGRTGGTTEYVRSGTTGEYGLSAVALDFGRPAAATDYCHQGGSPGYGGYTTYEPTYMYKDSTVPSPPKTPTTPQPGDATKIFGYGGPRVPRVPLATFGKINNHSPGDGSSHPEQGRPRPTYESSTTSVPAPNTAAAVTAAAQTALATATAPAFVGASNTNRSAPRGTVTPAPAATHTVALRQQSSTTSGSDTGTVYEQSENTGTIKRRKSVKKENVTKSVVTQDTDKPYDKPLKGVLKQTSAYDKPKPLMAKAPGASPSASASSLSSNTSVEVGSGASGTNETAHEPLQKTPSVKKGTRVATPGIRRKNKSDNHTTTATMQTDSPK